MADDKKTPPAPLKEEEVHVTVTPKDKNNPDHRKTAEKVKETVKKEVKKALDDNKGGGSGKQFEEADRRIDQAKEQVNPKQVEKINVKVKGKDGEGDEVVRERTVKPKGA